MQGCLDYTIIFGETHLPSLARPTFAGRTGTMLDITVALGLIRHSRKIVRFRVPPNGLALS